MQTIRGVNADSERSLPRWKTIAVIVLSLIPVLLGFMSVHWYATNVLQGDQCLMMTILRHAGEHTLSFGDFSIPLNEHRMIVAKFLLFCMESLSGVNTVVESYVNFSLLVVLFGMVVFMFVRKFGLVRSHAYIPLLSFFLLSWAQAENWLYGLQLSFVLAALSAMSIFVVFDLWGDCPDDRFLPWPFLSAVVLALAGSFSAAHGIMAWPVGGLQLAFNRGLRERRLHVIWWSLCVFVWGIYLLGYHRPASSPPMVMPWSAPGNLLKYCVFLFGGILVDHPALAFLGGLIALPVLTVCLFRALRAYRPPVARLIFWGALLAYGVEIMLMGAVGRGFMPDRALTSRYVTSTNFIYVGILGILLECEWVWGETAIRRYRQAFVALMLAGISWHLWSSVRLCEYDRFIKRYAAHLLRDFENEPYEKHLDRVWYVPSPTNKTDAMFLKNNSLSVFAVPQEPEIDFSLLVKNPLPPLAALSRNTVYLIKENGVTYVVVNGWALNRRKFAPARGVYVLLNGKPYRAVYGVEVPDAYNYYYRYALKYTAFEKVFVAGRLPDGRYDINIRVVNGDGTYDEFPAAPVAFINGGGICRII